MFCVISFISSKSHILIKFLFVFNQILVERSTHFNQVWLFPILLAFFQKLLFCFFFLLSLSLSVHDYPLETRLERKTRSFFATTPFTRFSSFFFFSAQVHLLFPPQQREQKEKNIEGQSICFSPTNRPQRDKTKFSHRQTPTKRMNPCLCCPHTHRVGDPITRTRYKRPFKTPLFALRFPFSVQPSLFCVIDRRKRKKAKKRTKRQTHNNTKKQTTQTTTNTNPNTEGKRSKVREKQNFLFIFFFFVLFCLFTQF